MAEEVTPFAAPKHLPMDNSALDLVDELDDFPEFFRCCVCLELLYKPVVLACGHVSCFWCVHKAMSGAFVSHCPICRHRYLHFPAVCQLLHFLLHKLSPMIYKEREKILLEQEKEMGFFSPEIPPCLATESACTSNASNIPECVSYLKEELSSCTATSADNNSPHNVFLTSCGQSCQEDTDDRKDVADIGDDFCDNDKGNGSSEQISVADVLCISCKQLLVQPVVLNCGHVYCMSCLEPMNDGLKCQDCQSPHPGEFPKVCLEFDHFLEEQFPKEYIDRRESLHQKLVHRQKEETTITAEEESSKTSTKSKMFNISSLGHRDSNVNVGVGCDSCGMFPIIGKWYRCMDCTEKIGFDLCERCYSTKSKLPGRFNQKHTSDHRLRLVQPNRIRRLMMQLMVEDGSAVLVPSDDESDQGGEDSAPTS